MLKRLLVSLLLFASLPALAQFTPGQVLTAAQLNSALGAKTTNSAAAITGGTITGLSAPIPLGSGGTGATTATGATSALQYNQGGSGAVNRSLTNKFQDRVNVRDFGATCNGTGTGDTVGITNAVAAVATGGQVDFPVGNCVTGPLSFTGLNSVVFKGQGRNASTITLASSGIALEIGASNWVTIEDMGFRPSGSPQSLANAYGIQLDNGTGNTIIRNVNASGFSMNGVSFLGTSSTGLSGNVLQDSYLLGNGQYQLYMSYSNDFHVTDNQFGMLSGFPHSLIGAYLVNSSAGTYSGNYHWENVVGYRQDSSNYLRVLGNRFEQSDQQGVYINGGNQLTFANNDVHTNSQTGNGLYDDMYVTGLSNAVIGDNKIYHWDSTYPRWGLNIDTGSSQITLGKNKISTFSSSYGPVRFDSSLTAVFGDVQMVGATSSTVAAGGTVYLGVNGSQSTEANTVFVATRRMTVKLMYTATNAAPGASQSYTYTLRVNGVSTAMTATSSGASSFVAQAATSTPAILLNPGDQVSIQLVTSSGATATNHRFYIEAVEY
ncbi:right-handed parallel beta-helix repeat-containing protein [Paraburkholderia atlantica]|uniref:right-handed parallel beta-helix repeat-containing protein n=1 Tax=Paraburkholderia atlantica TaxID=2654982 RepID=UPI00161B7AE0|nr:right-handed parallel beta-helix repeat-containing protein [Paraburkholderia atlantica]MBB5414122.1 hypothetical protein [Paraburkholderia atlantica]